MFSLNERSTNNLHSVHPSLVAVAVEAARLSTVPFVVIEGARSIQRQKQLVREGKSKTLRSKHLVQPDGYAHAFDAAPEINGDIVWDTIPIRKVADAMRSAAVRLNILITWGSVWDRYLNDLGSGVDGLNKSVREYCARHPGPDFIDGPHFQIGR